ncbi:hypothetical protein FDP41_006396 [Naegleria fowleri]|uniref:NAD-dependent epimerase/dehydratase domain-containing protein n=1 Tax=Naegleria fowleri TaxID=5763 RepID=A0A6A5BJZ6_NAEFO|nr:uncharacterized protein FDP41_006396 [Naegleria fowleri]KAF0974364.1 hypothetical protein FDP41_006396 [Naegleria fowleri]CAG4708659.1 unnamed protein product [Naegleria fowleri]
MSSSSAASSSRGGIKAVVIGSTGLIGKNLVRLLAQQDPNVYSKVVAISRRKENPFQFSDTTVPIDHVYLDNFDQLNSIENVFDGMDEAYCCLGTTIKAVGNDKKKFRHVDYDYPEAFASLVYSKFANPSSSSSQNNVKQFFLVTAVGADSQSMFFYNQVKGDIEKACAKKQLDYVEWYKTNHSGSSSIIPTYCHIIKPGLLIGERENEHRFGERIAQGLNNALDWMLPRSWSGIKGEDVAKAMIQIARVTRKQQQLDVLKERDTHNTIGDVSKEDRFEKHIFAHGNATLKDYAQDYDKQ